MMVSFHSTVACSCILRLKVASLPLPFLLGVCVPAVQAMEPEAEELDPIEKALASLPEVEWWDKPLLVKGIYYFRDDGEMGVDDGGAGKQEVER